MLYCEPSFPMIESVEGDAEMVISRFQKDMELS